MSDTREGSTCTCSFFREEHDMTWHQEKVERDEKRLDDMEEAQRHAHHSDVRYLKEKGHTEAARDLAEFREVPYRIRL